LNWTDGSLGLLGGLEDKDNWYSKVGRTSVKVAQKPFIGYPSRLFEHTSWHQPQILSVRALAWQ
jgi:hypothetical protein